MGNLRGKPLSPNTVLVEWEPPTNKRLARFLFRFRPLEYNDSNIIDKWLGPSLNNYVLNGLKGAESYFISVIPYFNEEVGNCLLYTSPSPRDLSTSRMPSSA